MARIPAAPSVLVTGCSSGFGRALVPAFLEAGWQVFATLRRADERASLFADERRAHGKRLTVLSLDVTRFDDRARALHFLNEKHGGRLDCLVNNAGHALFGALEDMSEEQLRDQLEVNFFGAALLMRTLLPALRAARGRVIQVSSVLGYHGFPLSSAYCASKFALEGLSESLVHELAPHGVQVALVEPGAHHTRFGENLDWAEGAQDPSSPYAQLSERYRAFRARQRSGGGASEEAVIRTIVSLASRRRMPLRVRVGKDAKLAHVTQRLLPQWMAQWLFRNVYRRLLSR